MAGSVTALWKSSPDRGLQFLFSGSLHTAFCPSQPQLSTFYFHCSLSSLLSINFALPTITAVTTQLAAVSVTGDNATAVTMITAVAVAVLLSPLLLSLCYQLSTNDKDEKQTNEERMLYWA
jgi:uncharacterized membrane protein (DUF485 family)